MLKLKSTAVYRTYLIVLKVKLVIRLKWALALSVTGLRSQKAARSFRFVSKLQTKRVL